MLIVLMVTRGWAELGRAGMTNFDICDSQCLRVSACPCDPPGPPGCSHTRQAGAHILEFQSDTTLQSLSSHSPGASIGLNAELWLPWEQSDANLAGSDWFLPELQLAS